MLPKQLSIENINWSKDNTVKAKIVKNSKSTNIKSNNATEINFFGKKNAYFSKIFTPSNKLFAYNEEASIHGHCIWNNETIFITFEKSKNTNFAKFRAYINKEPMPQTKTRGGKSVEYGGTIVKNQISYYLISDK
jgi:hypothetical protein